MSATRPLRVLLADDSEIFRSALADALAAFPSLQVNLASDGREAVQRTCDESPDVVLMDIHMPVMGGLEAIRQIMARCPTPILVITSASERELVPISMEALSCGALEVVPKPSALPVPAAEIATIVERIELLASVSVVRHPRAARRPRSRPPIAAKAGAARMVGFSSSSGGPSALATILADLPSHVQLPMVIAQHLDSAFAPALASWLEGVSNRRVRVASEGARLAPRTVWLIPQGTDATIDAHGEIHLCPPENSRVLNSPSGDRLFRSLARSFGPAACGVVLTGMGRDGAEGLLEMKRAGGLTIAQDGASSAVDGMPRAARDMDAALLVLSLEDIAPTLGRMLRPAREARL